MQKVIRSERLGESYLEIDHPTGLKILLCPMKGYQASYAYFATRYGSINTCFKTQQDADFVKVPEGIAHFLEHKLFESEEGDAFVRYAKTGASANAYTSFDRTAYLFSCAGNFPETIEILLDFVTHPYFTQATVEKEQGIIGQEIMMMDDDPDWCVYFGLLRALYHNHPVRIDIAGTRESIAQIDADLLYRCYRTFYNLHNMVLVVAGGFDPKDVLEAADRILKPAEPITIQSQMPEEPDTVAAPRTEARLAVSRPLFQIGFKEIPDPPEARVRGDICSELLLELICGEASPLYGKLYREGLINPSFSTEVMSGQGYLASIFAGESDDPDAVAEAILEEIDRLRREGIPEDAFRREKKKLYGRYVRSLGGIESMAGALMMSFFESTGPYEVIELLAGLTLEDVEKRLHQQLRSDRMALSIVRPA